MILAFTGAGISKASGIPTFTDQGDLRTKLARSYANRHRDDYNKIISQLQEACDKAEPNDAHLALAEYKVPVLTMNIDGLHARAGSEHVVEMHGRLPNIVLYEDPAPEYQNAFELVYKLQEGDIFLIVGTSYYTVISIQLKIIAQSRGAKIVEINSNAEENVRKFLEENKDSIGLYEDFISREDT